MNLNKYNAAVVMNTFRKTYYFFPSDSMYYFVGSKPYSCPICMKAFASKYTHQAHLKTHQVSF